MAERVPSENDTRSVDDLFNIALTEQDPDLAWDSIAALHWRGTSEVLQRAEALSRSGCPQERRLAADVLGQLGVPARAFPHQSVPLLFKMLNSEHDPDVLHAIFVAFSHNDVPEFVDIAPGFATHPDADVRHAIVLALAAYEDVRAIDLLIQLSIDPDSNVRDWATFGLGTQLKIDSPEIRNALAARLDDPDDNARGEAMVGLASRKDPRVVDAIRRNLASGAAERAIEAATLVESPELLDSLVALRGTEGIEPSFLEDAINACSRR